jgi:hypothetical protein
VASPATLGNMRSLLGSCLFNIDHLDCATYFLHHPSMRSSQHTPSAEQHQRRTQTELGQHLGRQRRAPFNTSSLRTSMLSASNWRVYLLVKQPNCGA